jgi:hypothetical protein
MTAPGRRSSTFTRLLRHGFTDPSAAERLLDGVELAPVRNDPVLLRRWAPPPTRTSPCTAWSASWRHSPTPPRAGSCWTP